MFGPAVLLQTLCVVGLRPSLHERNHEIHSIHEMQLRSATHALPLSYTRRASPTLHYQVSVAMPVAVCARLCAPPGECCYASRSVCRCRLWQVAYKRSAGSVSSKGATSACQQMLCQAVDCARSCSSAKLAMLPANVLALLQATGNCLCAARGESRSHAAVPGE
jgi:hypothetical protein